MIKMEDKQITPIVVSVVRKGNSILMINRNKEPYKGRNALIGGRIEFGESVLEAAVREVKEESGLNTVASSILSVCNETIADENGVNIHLIMFIVKCDLLESDINKIPVGNEKEGEVAFKNIFELHSEDIVPSDIEIIKNFVLKENPIDIVHFHVKKNDNQNYKIEKM